ncbi:MAG: histidine phosphatase family protein [Rhodospirillales bacterium]|nr:histidine phosphatase family protein [Rhodospirillales bacterium]
MQKTLYLIRHGQSTVNAARAANGVDPMHFDSPLSPLGHEQVAQAREAVAALQVELVVTSPLTRAIQTAIGLFGGRRVPMVVEALPHERCGWSCDVGRQPHELQATFPELSFDHLERVWWYAEGADANGIAREPDDRVDARRAAFLAWLAERQERHIAVVGHSMFFRGWVGRLLSHCEVHRVHVDAAGRLDPPPLPPTDIVKP